VLYVGHLAADSINFTTYSFPTWSRTHILQKPL